MARKIEVQLVGDSRSLERALSKTSMAGGRFGSVLGKLGKVALATGVALGGGLAVAAKIAFDEIAEAQKATAQTNAVIKSTGGAAKVTTKEVLALSEALMLKSGVDDEVIQSGQNMLLTFKQIRNETGKGNDIFNQATKATLDLSVAMGKDMKDSAILVGKALNDPIRGLTAMRRVGIQFTEAQEKQIKAMVESGNIMGAQKMILAELNSEFGKSAEAVGRTLPGQFNILKESAKNLLAEGFQPLVPALTKVVQVITRNLPRIREIASAVFGGVRTVAAALVGWFQQHFPRIRAVALAVFGAVRGFIVGTVIPAFNRFRDFVSETVRRVAAVLQANRGRLLSIWQSLRTIIGNVIEVIRNLAPIIRGVLIPALRAAIPIIQAVTAVMATLSGWAAATANAIGNVVDQLNRIKGPSLLEILGRQHGGSVTKGRPYMVGERGPELFVPRRSGTIVPNSRLGASTGGGGTMTAGFPGDPVIVLTTQRTAKWLQNLNGDYSRQNGGRSIW